MMTKLSLSLVLLLAFTPLAFAQRFPRIANTIAEMVASNPNVVHTNVQLVAYRTTNDSGGGDFNWVRNSVVATNLGTSFASTYPGAAGRYLRQYSGSPTPAFAGAYGDDVTDDTVAIQAMLNLGQGLEVGEHTYIANQLNIPNNTILRGISHSSVIKNKPGSIFPLIGLQSNPILQSNITIQNLTIDGNKANCAIGSGIVLSGTNIAVLNCYIHDTVDNGVNLGYAVAGGNYRILDNYFFNCGKAGRFFGAIGVVSGNGSLVQGNQIVCTDGGAHYGIDVEPNTGTGPSTIGSITISQNTIIGGIMEVTCDNVTNMVNSVIISDNIIDARGAADNGFANMMPLFLRQFSGFKVTGNVLWQHDTVAVACNGIYAYRLSNGDIRNNLLFVKDTGRADEYSIQFDDLALPAGVNTNITVMDNRIISTSGTVNTGIFAPTNTLLSGYYGRNIFTGVVTNQVLNGLEVHDFAADLEFTNLWAKAFWTTNALVRQTLGVGQALAPTRLIEARSAVGAPGYILVDSSETDTLDGIAGFVIRENGTTRWSILNSSNGGDPLEFRNQTNGVVLALGQSDMPADAEVLTWVAANARAEWVAGGGAGATNAYTSVQDEGVPLAARTTINFAGAGVTATDSGGLTLVTIPGGGGGSGNLTSINGLTNATQFLTNGGFGAGTLFSTSGTDTQVLTTSTNYPMLMVTNNVLFGTEVVTGTTPAINFNTPRVKTWALSANSTPTFSNVPSAAGAGRSIELSVTNTTFTINWDDSVYWPPDDTELQPMINTVTAFIFKWDGVRLLGFGDQLASAGGGSTINPTDTFLPYRLNSTTFSNSPLARTSATLLTSTAIISVPDGTGALPGFTFGGGTIGLLKDGTGALGLSVSSTQQVAVGIQSLIVHTNTVLGFSPSPGVSSPDVTWRIGSGSPESVVSANKGSFFMRRDGDTNTMAYIKSSGSGNTGWTPLTTGTSGSGSAMEFGLFQGSGADDALGTSAAAITFGGGAAQVTLPTAGAVYQIALSFQSQDTGAFAQYFVLTNITDAKIVRGSTNTVIPSGDYTQHAFSGLYTNTTAGSTLQLWGYTSNGSATNANVHATNTVLSYINLSTGGGGGGGTGDVVGPASSTDNAHVRFDTGTGKLVQNGKWVEDDNGNVLVGNDSQASLTLQFKTSGASDPLLTISNGLITETGSFTASANITAQGNLTTGASGGIFFGASRTQMAAPVNGELTLMDSTGATFSLLNFGGVTASYPALQRTNATLAVMLADESARGDLLVAGEVYSAGWDGSFEVPNKNDLYDKIQTLSGGGITSLTGDVIASGSGAVSSVVNPVAVATSVAAIHTIGDSITHGYSSGATTSSWPYLFASANAVTNINLAYAGARIVDQIWQISPGFSFTNAYTNVSVIYTAPSSIVGNMLTASLTGYNDYRDYNSAAYITHFTNALNYLIAFSTIPTTNKVYAQAAASSGTWTNDSTLWGGDMAKVSSTVGDTITFTNVEGTAVYIAAAAYPSTNGTRSFSVTIDGVLMETNTLSGAYGNRQYELGDNALTPDNIGTNGAIAWSPWLYRYSRLSNKPHTILLTTKSVTSGPVEILWVASNHPKLLEGSGPTLLMGDVLRMGTYDGTGSADNAATFRENILLSVRRLQQDGLKVTLADTGNQFDPGIGMSADVVHPNATGHAQIANAFLRAASLDFHGMTQLSPATVGPMELYPTGEGAIIGRTGATRSLEMKGSVENPTYSQIKFSYNNSALDRRMNLTGSDISVFDSAAAAKKLSFGAAGGIGISIGTPTTAMSTLLPAFSSLTGSGAIQMGIENTAASGASGGGFLAGFSNDGAAMASGDRLGGFSFGGSSSATSLRIATTIESYASQAWVDTSAYGSRMGFLVTPNSTITKLEKLGIEQDGRITFGDATASGPGLIRSTEYLSIVDGAGGTTSGLMINGTTPIIGVRSATATLDFGSILTLASADLTITVTGAAVGDSVSLGLPAAVNSGTVYNGFVSSANTITVRCFNVTGSSIDPASATYRATVHSF